MNIKLLRRVQKAILKHPDQFEMERWFNETLTIKGGVPAGGCGTAACIGGWALHLHGKKKTINVTRSTVASTVCPYKLLRLESDIGQRLFLHKMWPPLFYANYRQAKTAKARAKIAAARIDLFIATKGRE